jgi:hypothetical protein
MVLTMISLLAQASTPDPETASWTGFYGALAIAGMLGIGMVIVIIVRKRSDAMQSRMNSFQSSFTLHDLRKLHEDGQLTDEEFERAKGRMLAAGKAQLEESEPGEEKSKSLSEIIQERRESHDPSR